MWMYLSGSKNISTHVALSWPLIGESGIKLGNVLFVVRSALRGDKELSKTAILVYMDQMPDKKLDTKLLGA